MDEATSVDEQHPSEHLDALHTGIVLREYTIERAIGQGGFGITYLAHDSVFDRLVAIKEFLPTDIARRFGESRVGPRATQFRESYEWGLGEFLEEAKLIDRLEHPNVVRVRSFFRDNDTAYLVMEYIDGPTLSAWLQNHGSPSSADLIAMLRALSSGLDHIHSRDCLHRDIKPDNIILRAGHVAAPVLIDFGAARKAVAERTRSVAAIVSAGYTPLEQYSSHRTLTPATDLYALCAVAYRCITGEEPPVATERAIADMLPRLVERGAGRFPDELLRALDAGLALRVTDRPATLHALRAALGEPVSTPAPAVPVATPTIEPTGAAAIVARSAERDRNRKTMKVDFTAGSEEPKEPAVPAPPRPVRSPIVAWPMAKWPIGKRVLVLAVVCIAALIVAGGYWWLSPEQYTVESDGTGDFTTIGAALAHVAKVPVQKRPPGGFALRVGPGTYRENVRIETPVKLTGAGGPVIEGIDNDQPTLDIAGSLRWIDRVVVRDFTVTGQAIAHPLVRVVEGGVVRLKDNVFEAGPNSESCVISISREPTYDYRSRGAELSGNTFRGRCVEVSSGAAPQLTDNLLDGVREHQQVIARGHSWIQMIGNRYGENGSKFYVTDVAKLSLRGGTVHGPAPVVVAEDSSRVELRKVVIHSNAYGRWGPCIFVQGRTSEPEGLGRTLDLRRPAVLELDDVHVDCGGYTTVSATGNATATFTDTTFKWYENLGSNPRNYVSAENRPAALRGAENLRSDGEGSGGYISLGNTIVRP